MKRDSVQNFLRIILMTGMLFLLGTQWSWGTEEKSSQTISPVSLEVLESQIKKVETTNLNDEDKKNLTGLYTLSLANIQKALSFTTEAESFRKAKKNCTRSNGEIA